MIQHKKITGSCSRWLIDSMQFALYEVVNVNLSRASVSSTIAFVIPFSDLRVM